MFDLEFLRIYTGAEIANAIRYNQSNDIECYIASKYDFKQRVERPKRPGKWAARNAWNEYNYQLEKYNCYIRSVDATDKFVLDLSRDYVITKNGGKIWLNYRTKKEVSLCNPELTLNPQNYVGYYIPERYSILVRHSWKLYLVNFYEQTITPWTGG